MKSKTWRLLLTPEATNGAWNMALDEALLRSVAEHHSPPTLRLFSWQPATLSLGFAQPAVDVDHDNLARLGWGLVRRPTGGRAILHVDELTYSLTVAADDPLLSGDLLESYRKISRGLLAGLSRLRVTAAGDATYENTPPGKVNNPVCFEIPSNYEIISGGKKLIGSAQARKYGGILQHGTLPIHGDITRITRVLKFSSEEDRAKAAEKLTAHAVTLETVLGDAPEWMTVANAIVEGFSEIFEISFIDSHPDSSEIESANQFMSEKYISDTWTFRI